MSEAELEPREAARRLAAVLDAEHDLYELMRELLQEEREALLLLDAAALESLTLRKQALADEARVLEEGRQGLTRRLAGPLGLDAEGLRLSEICVRLDPHASELRRAHNRLLIVVGVVRELLDANAELAGRSQAQVRATLEALGALLPERGGYHPGGRPGSAPGQLVRESA